jgi:multiple sugar transport system permease protein
VIASRHHGAIIVYIYSRLFRDLPKELEEAVLIDGGSVWSTFRYTAFAARPSQDHRGDDPFSFIFSWNNFVFGAVLAGRETTPCRSPSTTC